jgi:hypothetical protein
MNAILFGAHILLNVFFCLSFFLPSCTNQFHEHSAQWTQPASDGTYQYFIKVGIVCICIYCSSITSSPLAYVFSNHNCMTNSLGFLIQVVPTIYTDIRGRKIDSNQVSGAHWMITCSTFLLSTLMLQLLLSLTVLSDGAL